MIEFRDLKAEEIEARVAMARDNGLQLLLYKNARVDMQILDETCGAENWTREHYEAGGSLFCRVAIRTAASDWVAKSDAGSESNTEPEKGRASDSFKRACTNWGIGRELYTSPFIWVSAGKYKTRPDGKPNDRFCVRSIGIVDKKIVSLEIANSAGDIVYTYGTKPPRKAEAKAPEEKPARYLCATCGKEVNAEIGAKSIAKYNRVYCSKKCYEERIFEDD